MPEMFLEIHLQITALRDEIESLETHPGISAQTLMELKDSLFCFETGVIFYAEANKAIQAEVWFAGAAMAASALESILLAKCIGDRRRVMALPKWAELTKIHKGKFEKFIKAMDLGKLLAIAKDLDWFPKTGISEHFKEAMATHAGADVAAQIDELFLGDDNVGLHCARYAHEYRNMLHPSACLRERHQPSANAGKSATLVFMIAFMALAEHTKIFGTGD